MRTVLLLAAILVCGAGLAQPTDWLDDFSAPQLDARWQEDMGRSGSITVDAKRQILVLKGGDNTFNHIEADLPPDVSLVQADMNNVTDISASWSPSVILYWGPRSYLRVMLSLIYGLRVEVAPADQTPPQIASVQPLADTWYRVRLALTADSVEVFFGEQAGAAASVGKVRAVPSGRAPAA